MFIGAAAGAVCIDWFMAAGSSPGSCSACGSRMRARASSRAREAASSMSESWRGGEEGMAINKQAKIWG